MMVERVEIGNGLTLVPVGADDVPRLTRLQRAAYEPWLAIIGMEPLPYRQDYAALLADHDAWFAASGENGEAGALILKAEADHLLIWSVAAAVSGRGLGRALMDFAEAEARRRGLAEIRLYTHVLMARNIALYQRLGYVETGREDTPDGRRIVHMAKRIDA